MWNHVFRGSGVTSFSIFRHPSLSTPSRRVVFKFRVVYGVTFRQFLRLKRSLDWFGRQRQFEAQKDLREFKEFEDFGERGGVPMITSGLGLSWVMVPLGPWSLERGRGDPAGNWSRLALEARWRISFNHRIINSSIVMNSDIIIWKQALLNEVTDHQGRRLNPPRHPTPHNDPTLCTIKFWNYIAALIVWGIDCCNRLQLLLVSYYLLLTTYHLPPTTHYLHSGNSWHYSAN